MADRLPLPWWQATDALGVPLPGSKLDTYEAGTSTRKPLYADAGLTIPHPNPVIADSAGRFPDLFTAAGGYKAVWTDANGVQIRVADNLPGATSSSATAAAGTGDTNVLINGDFRIQQRAGGATGDAAYGIDRWYVLTESGNVTVGTVDPGSAAGADTAIRLTQPDVVAKRIGLAQIVERANARHLRGVAAAMAGRLRCSLAVPIRYAILGWTGTADTVTRDVVNNWSSTSYTAGGFFNAANLTVVATGEVTPGAATWTDMPDLTGIVSASANNLVVVVWTKNAVAQSTTLDLTAMRLGGGETAPGYVPRSIGQEQRLCDRYYQTIRVSILAYAHIIGEFFGVSVPFRSRMHHVPTMGTAAAHVSTNLNLADYNNMSADGAQYFVQAGVVGTTAAVVTATAEAEL